MFSVGLLIADLVSNLRSKVVMQYVWNVFAISYLRKEIPVLVKDVNHKQFSNLAGLQSICIIPSYLYVNMG